MLDLTDRRKCFYWQTDRNLTGDEYVRIFLHRHDVPIPDLIRVLQNGITFRKNPTVTVQAPSADVLKGNVNIVREISINGKSYIVRMHPPGVKNGYFYAEKLALDACGKAGLPVPKVLEIHEAENEADMDFMLMTKSSGVNMAVYLEKNDTPEQKILFDAGKKMAGIHKVKVKKYGCFDNEIAKKQGKLVGLHESYNDFVRTGLEENLDRLIHFDIISQEQRKDFLGIFTSRSYEPPDGPRIVHNDMADWNLLTDGREITAILDWDECHAGDPVADLACWSTFFSIERMADFLKGYMSEAILPMDYDDRFHFYRMRYTISKMALRCKRYAVDKDEFVLAKINVGKQALAEESAYFQLE